MKWRGVAMVLLLLGCTEKRYVCEACLPDSDGDCGKSRSIPDRKQEHARCSAANELCTHLFADDKKGYARICQGRKHDPMTTGCERAVLDAMKITCTTTTAFHVPLLIDL